MLGRHRPWGLPTAVRGLAFRAHLPCTLAVRPPSCGMAVGRDVPIAPPRLGAVRAMVLRAIARGG